MKLCYNQMFEFEGFNNSFLGGLVYLAAFEMLEQVRNGKRVFSYCGDACVQRG
jgi:hypothetical protein